VPKQKKIRPTLLPKKKKNQTNFITQTQKVGTIKVVLFFSFWALLTHKMTEN